MRRRIGELMWVPAHLTDIESDMSAVHRVDDIQAMPAARFFRFAHRLAAYRGVMRERAIALQREREDEPQYAPVRQAQPGRASKPAPGRAPVTEAALSDPVMSKIFSFG